MRHNAKLRFTLRENVSEEARPIVDDMLRHTTSQAEHWKNELDEMGVDLADDSDRLPTP